jgi:hypothetical protein
MGRAAKPAAQQQQQHASTAQTLSPDAILALTAAAASLEAEGRSMEAIHCLLALLGHTDGLTPLQQAQIRLKLGTLLLDCTANIKVSGSCKRSWPVRHCR